MKQEKFIRKAMHFALMLAILSLSAMTGCKSNPSSRKLSEEESIKMAEEKPTVRQWGTAKHHKQSFAIQFAEADARAKMARAIKSAITTASNDAGFSFAKYSTDGKAGSTVTDEDGKSNAFVEAVTEEAVANTSVIKTDRYLLENGQYEVYVCVEFNEALSEISKSIVNNITQRVSEEDRVKIEVRTEEFQDKIAKKIAKNMEESL